MIKTSSIGVFVVAVLATLVLLPRWLGNVEPAGPSVKCDLMSESGCSWDTGSGSYNANLELAGEEAEGWVYNLSVTGPERGGRMLAVLTGESMYMGEYPVPLSQQEQGVWQAEFVAPFCTEEERMVWNVDLKAGEQPLHDNTLTLLFRAPEKG